MDEFFVRNLSASALEDFDAAACWAYFLSVPRLTVRVSTFAYEGVKEALDWHAAIMKLPFPTRTILEGDVATPDVIVWLAGMERRISPDCRWLKTRDTKLDAATLLKALPLLDRFIPCTDREREQGWHKRIALDLLVGNTVIYGPKFLSELFFIPA